MTVYIEEWKATPEEAGMIEKEHTLPDGSVIIGIRMKDHGRRPLADGIVEVGKRMGRVDIAWDPLNGSSTWECSDRFLNDQSFFLIYANC